MNSTRNWTLLTGAVIGAAAMYLLDPGAGRRRRAIVRDKAARAARRTGGAIGSTSRHLANRTRGLTAGLRDRLSRDTVSDAVIVDRIRAALGHIVSSPSALDVTSRDGIVCISGPVLVTELDELMSTIRSIRGVCDVETDLEIHDAPGKIATMQGGYIDPRRREERFAKPWSPRAKLIAGLTGGAIALGLGLATRNTAGPWSRAA